MLAFFSHYYPYYFHGPFLFHTVIDLSIVRLAPHTHTRAYKMLRRCGRQLYRYQEFEMHNQAKYPFYYPREAPNTSVFPQYQISFWMSWGWGRQELWVDSDTRRYETTWQMTRRLLMWLFPLYFALPVGLPVLMSRSLYGEYGERPFLELMTHAPMDNHYIEWGGSSLDAEWLRHIHSKESF